MKKLLQFILFYFIAVITLIIIYFMATLHKEDLKIYNSQLDGLKYLHKISDLSVAVSDYIHGNECSFNKNKLKQNHLNIDSCIRDIYDQQQLNKLFIDEKFNAQLESIRLSETTEEQYLNFLNALNYENYTVGDKSQLLFEKDRELFFLSSLITHYSPEYLISILLTHYIIHEFENKFEISAQKKYLFIEQTKLSEISLKEIDEIINKLDKYENIKTLQNLTQKMKKEMESLISLQTGVHIWEIESKSRQEYLNSSQKLINFSLMFIDEQYRVTKDILEEKRDTLKSKMFDIDLIFALTLVIFSFLLYLFYKVSASNKQKDLEIQKITKTLDQFVVFCKTDAKGVITYTSSALETLSGYSKKELIGNTPRLFKHENTNLNIYKEMWETITAKKVYSGHLLNKTKSGDAYWADIIIVPELNARGAIASFSAYIIDITHQKALQNKSEELLLANEKLEKLSVIDTLTRIYNRLKLDIIMKSNYESYQRYKKVFSIIMIDIDHFKSVNDTYGHLVGDETLKSVVEIIKNTIRSTDILGRWGGEEFMIICEETSCRGAYKLSEKVRKLIQEHTFETIGKKTISCGVSQIEDGLNINEFIQRADDALYKAKNGGRNQTCSFTPEKEEKDIVS